MSAEFLHIRGRRRARGGGFPQFVAVPGAG
jgi:hypothetical protein